jgi:hypothetical protein
MKEPKEPSEKTRTAKLDLVLEANEAPAQTHEEENEKFPAPPADTYPELAVSLRILEQNVLKFIKEKYGTVVEDVDLDKLLQLMRDAEPEFSQAEEYLKQLGELTEIPEDRVMFEKFNALIRQTEEILQESGLLPQDFKQKKADFPPLAAEYLSDYPLQGHFISHDVNHMFGYDPKEPKNVIRIGGKRLAPFATNARSHAKKLGFSLTKEQSLDLILAHVVAHEYGHYLETLYEEFKYSNEQFFKRAEQVSSNALQLDQEQDRYSVHGERFAQSIAQVVVKKLLAELNVEPSQQRQFAMHLGSLDIKKIQGFKRLAEWGKQNGLSTGDVSGLLLKARITLREAGREDQAEGIEYDWRHAGYYLPTYDEKKLRYIIQGV